MAQEKGYRPLATRNRPSSEVEEPDVELVEKEVGPAEKKQQAPEENAEENRELSHVKDKNAKAEMLRRKQQQEKKKNEEKLAEYEKLKEERIAAEQRQREMASNAPQQTEEDEKRQEARIQAQIRHQLQQTTPFSEKIMKSIMVSVENFFKWIGNKIYGEGTFKYSINPFTELSEDEIYEINNAAESSETQRTNSPEPSSANRPSRRNSRSPNGPAPAVYDGPSQSEIAAINKEFARSKDISVQAARPQRRRTSKINYKLACRALSQGDMKSYKRLADKIAPADKAKMKTLSREQLAIVSNASHQTLENHFNHKSYMDNVPPLSLKRQDDDKKKRVLSLKEMMDQSQQRNIPRPSRRDELDDENYRSPKLGM